MAIRYALERWSALLRYCEDGRIEAQVIVAKWADHQPLHRQEKMFERHGIEISRKTMGGWMAQCAELLDPLYQLMKKELLSSKVIGTDDTSVKVLDRKLPFARIGPQRARTARISSNSDRTLASLGRTLARLGSRLVESVEGIPQFT